MKSKILVFIIIATALTLAVVSTVPAAAPPPPLLTEIKILTNPTNYLAASEIRLVPGGWGIDSVAFKPVPVLLIEAWGEDVDNGVTNRSVIRTMTLSLNTAQQNAWNSAANGQTFIEGAALQKTRLTKRTP